MTHHLRPLGPAIGLAVLALLARDSQPIAAQPKATPVTVSPQSPTINVPFPLGVQKAKTLELTLTGTNLNDPTALWTSFPAKITFPTDANNGKEPGKLRVKIDVPADAPIGFHSIRLATKHGLSNARMFCVDDVPQLDETADNHTVAKAQPVPYPCVVVGRTDAEVSDYFKVAVKAGQRLTFDVIGRRLGSQLDPVIKLYDARTGREIPGRLSDDEPSLQSDARLTVTFPTAGEYAVELRDTKHTGGGEHYYRLRIVDSPAAMTAWPVAVKRGTSATVGFTGRHVEGAAPVVVPMPADGTGLNVAPRGPNGTGWPVFVAASDIDELVEAEPNNEPAKANRLPVPSGITARFLEKGDIDHFVFTAKKGAKYSIVAQTYEILSLAEVFLTVKDAKGTVLGRSNEAVTPARIDLTAAADGDLTIVAEHQSYLHGPTEVYHLSVRETAPDFDVQLQLDRVSFAPGETALIPIPPATRRDYTGPIELTVVGPAGFSGTVSVPNAPPPPPNQPVPVIAHLPVTVAPGTAAGAYELKVVAKATINGKVISKPASVGDLTKAALNGLSFPPPPMLVSVGAGVTGPSLFSLSIKYAAPEVIRGQAVNVTVSAKRDAGFAEQIDLAPLTLPANVALGIKPIPKGANEVTFPVTPAANAALGPIGLTLRGGAKAAGKDFGYYSPTATVAVVMPVDVKVEPSPLPLKIGQKAKLKVTITRKGGYKGPVDVEVKNLPANVTAPKVNLPPDKTVIEVELSAAANAAAADKADVQVVATATAAANQATTAPNIVLKVAK